MAIWDQRSTVHDAVDDDGDAHRISRRVSLRGDRSFGPGGIPTDVGSG